MFATPPFALPTTLLTHSAAACVCVQLPFKLAMM